MNHTNRVILLLLLIMTGCHKLNNKYNTIDLECGTGVCPKDSSIKFLQNDDAEILQTEENLIAFHKSRSPLSPNSAHSGGVLFVAGQKLMHRQNPESGAF